MSAIGGAAAPRYTAEMPPAPVEHEYVVEAPPAPLEGIVRCLWRHRSDSAERRIEPIPPDGCPELIFNFGAPYAELDGAAERPQPRALFAGQLTKPLTLVAQGPVDTIGVRFEPHGARGFYGAAMQGATDRRLPLGDLRAFPESPFAEMRDAPHEARIRIVADFVLRALSSSPIDPLVAAAVRSIESDETPGAAETISLRQLQRRFVDQVGVSMREFRSIRRFRRVFDQIESRGNWIETALAAGYFDQAQMARDFRRYLGCTASDWARRRLGLAAAIAREASQSYKRSAPAPR